MKCVNDFIEALAHDDMCVNFRGRKIDFLGCYTVEDEHGNNIGACLRVYDVNSGKYLFNDVKATPSECIEALLDAPVFDGKKFYDVEKEMEVTDEWEYSYDEKKVRAWKAEQERFKQTHGTEK